jgi:glutamate carboxypeptidase
MFNQDNTKTYIEDLKLITSIDSKTRDKEGLTKVAKFFVQKALDLGLKSKFIENTAESGPLLFIHNLENPDEVLKAQILSNESPDKNPQLKELDSLGIKLSKTTQANKLLDVLLIAHIDTVYPQGTANARGFKVEGNKILAPGCVDNKGGALLGIYALKYVDLSKVKIALLLNINEEEGSIGSGEIIKKIASNTKTTLVLEPAREDGSLVEKRYGTLHYQIDVVGNGGSVLDLNADIKSPMAEVASILRNLSSIIKFNNNLITNVILLPQPELPKYMAPSKVSIGFYARYLDELSLKTIEKKIEVIRNSKTQGIEIEVKEISSYPNLRYTNGTRVLKGLVDVVGKKANLKITWQNSLGGSDACFASQTCDAVLDGFGPIGGKFHSEEEYLNVDSISERCNLLIDVIKKLSQGEHNVRREAK